MNVGTDIEGKVGTPVRIIVVKNRIAHRALHVHSRDLRRDGQEYLAEVAAAHAQRVLRDWAMANPPSFYDTSHNMVCARSHELVADRRFRKGGLMND